MTPGGLPSRRRQELRANIRLRLGLGLLAPLTSGQVRAQRATGRACKVCEQAIEAPNLEYELTGRDGMFLHAMCYAVWLEESQRLASG
jgi:hypothetical protein